MSNHDVMADPVHVVDWIYDQASLRMSGRPADAIRQWQAEHRASKHGTHRRSP